MMSRKWFTRVLIAVLAVSFVGLATASNFAFKLNALVRNPISRGGTATCTLCGEWTSLPIVSQFRGLRLFDICTAYPDFASVAAPGSCAGLGTNTTCDFTRIDALTTRSCTVAAGLAVNPLYQDQSPIRAILRTTTAGDRSAIIVGSDDPGRQILVRNPISRGGTATCTLCGTWTQLHYATTAVRAFDICLENTNFASVATPGSCAGLGNNTTCDFTRTDALTTRSCSVAAGLAVNPLVQIGKPMRIILKSTSVGDVLYSPAHF